MHDEPPGSNGVSEFGSYYTLSVQCSSSQAASSEVSLQRDNIASSCDETSTLQI